MEQPKRWTITQTRHAVVEGATPEEAVANSTAVETEWEVSKMDVEYTPVALRPSQAAGLFGRSDHG